MDEAKPIDMKSLMKSMKYFIIGISIISLLVVGIVIWIYILIPNRKDLTGCFETSMYRVKLCPGGPNYVYLNQISKYMQKSVIISEDSRFYEHKGFDWESIEKSAKENFTKGKIKRGGSTITQQLAKNLYLSKEKSMMRKFIEAFITIQIERHLTKKEILEKYLNVIEFGKDLFGIKSAAKYYFNKSPADLDVVESAFLTMLLPSPVKYAKSFQRKKLTPFAYQRVHKIIDDLFQYNRITDSEYDRAMVKLNNFFSKDSNESDEEIVDESADEDSNESLDENLDSDDDDPNSEENNGTSN